MERESFGVCRVFGKIVLSKAQEIAQANKQINNITIFTKQINISTISLTFTLTWHKNTTAFNTHNTIHQRQTLRKANTANGF